MLKMSVHYDTTPIEIREKIQFSDEIMEKSYVALHQYPHICEHIIISTCNRTEIIAVVDHVHGGKDNILHFLSEIFHFSQEELLQYCQFTKGEAVVHHLFRLASGLDSIVLGETQILGQVRDAFLLGQQYKTTGKMLNELSKRVIQFAKNAHHKTQIGEQPMSISYIAVELAKSFYPNIKEKSVCVVGIGEMGKLSIQNLLSAGVTDITILNRHVERGKSLAEKMDVQCKPFEALEEVLTEVDIVITSTSAAHTIITKDQLKQVMNKRKNKELLCIDIAVPRDIERAVQQIKGVTLYDVDDLKHVVDDNMQARKEAAKLIEEDIQEELLSFRLWTETLEAVPVIHALREKSFGIQAKTVESVFRKIPSLTERERKIIEKHTKSIVNQLMEQPIKQVKTMCEEGTFEQEKELFIDIFGLEDNMTEKR
ncbi:glutamyl-tRNA reductase [Pseudogracilibacillus sp. ICA-222130]|uniref:glutamyl-tRNA reductase n=1 Tax=Pseudogracilibacillus sp. ICA-222130 TaxID=3134655 RepID=UPI0030C19089